jgi:hypothetical protein
LEKRKNHKSEATLKRQIKGLENTSERGTHPISMP